jgi:hypothetical protein
VDCSIAVVMSLNLTAAVVLAPAVFVLNAARVVCWWLAS